MVKTNMKGRTYSIPSKVGMPTSSLNMKVPSSMRKLRSKNDNINHTSKSPMNEMNNNEQPPPHEEEETTIGKLTKILEDLRQKNANKQELVNNMIQERLNKTKTLTHISEREVSSHRSTTPVVELKNSQPVIEEVHSPKTLVNPPKSNYGMLLKKDKLL